LKRELANGLDDVVMQALGKSPSNRYSSVEEFSWDIDRFLSGQPLLARRHGLENATTALTVSAKGQRTNRRRALLVAALLLLLIGVAAFYFLKSAPTPVASLVKTIAVLPFNVATGNNRQQWLALGMADELTARLGRYEQFAVRPLSAVRGYLASGIAAQQAGNELDVEYVLSGNIRQAGEPSGASETVGQWTETNRTPAAAGKLVAPIVPLEPAASRNFVLNVYLLSVKNGATVWTMKFEASPAELPQIQETIVARVLGDLLAEAVTDQAPKHHRELINAEAYEAYLVGRYHFGQRSAQGLTEAVKQFQRALSHDNSFALAHAGLANCYLLLPSYQPAAPETYTRAKEQALKALALDEELAEAHTSLAQVQFLADRDRSSAEASFRRAIALNASYATARQWLAVTLSSLGRHNEALMQINFARQLDPHSAIILNDLGAVLFYARRYEEALAAARQALAVNPGLVPAHQLSSWIYQVTGRYEDALSEARQEHSFAGANAVEWPVLLAQVQAGAGRREDARVTLSQLDVARIVKLNSRKLAYGLAVAYAQTSDSDQALRWLAEAAAVKAFLFNFVWVDPRLDDLRTDPRFAKLARQAGLPN
jgi:TolB-like protein